MSATTTQPKSRSGTTTATAVAPGYKRTPVGVIPEEWTVRSLRSCLRVAPGYGINAAAVPFDESLPTYLRITDIGEDNRFRPSPRVSVKHPNASAYFLGEGDLVFARTGASVGKSYLYAPHDGPLVFAGFLIRVCPDPEELQPAYLAYWVQSKRYWDWVTAISIRSGQPGINAQEYGALQLPLPEPTEQGAIAEALSDVDGLLRALEALIDKKRAIKQAAMHQLLTGKTRLPGFSGEWNTIPLLDVADEEVPFSFVGGPFGSNLKASEYTASGVRILQLQNIGDGVFNDDYAIHTSEKKADELRNCNIFPGEIILSKMGDPVARACLVPSQDERYLMASDGIRLSVDRNRFSTRYALYYINSAEFRTKAIEASTGSTRMRISLSVLKRLPFRAPGLEEQTAIATILSEMDAEIVALERRRDKIRAIKRGMMQQLLSGRVRLIKTTEARVGA